jgi:hypothetical protein
MASKELVMCCWTYHKVPPYRQRVNMGCNGDKTYNMRLPTIHGYIDRRILVNFTLTQMLYEKLFPRHSNRKFIKTRPSFGICLIRLKNIKIKGLPNFFGVSSENGAIVLLSSGTKKGKQKKAFTFQEGIHLYG